VSSARHGPWRFMSAPLCPGSPCCAGECSKVAGAPRCSPVAAPIPTIEAGQGHRDEPIRDVARVPFRSDGSRRHVESRGYVDHADLLVGKEAGRFVQRWLRGALWTARKQELPVSGRGRLPSRQEAIAGWTRRQLILRDSNPCFHALSAARFKNSELGHSIGPRPDTGIRAVFPSSCRSRGRRSPPLPTRVRDSRMGGRSRDPRRTGCWLRSPGSRPRTGRSVSASRNTKESGLDLGPDARAPGSKTTMSAACPTRSSPHAMTRHPGAPRMDRVQDRRRSGRAGPRADSPRDRPGVRAVSSRPPPSAGRARPAGRRRGGSAPARWPRSPPRGRGRSRAPRAGSLGPRR